MKILVNKIKPRQLDKINIKQLLARGNIDELYDVIGDLSHENFEDNEYFEFKRDEKKLIKTYQFLNQYLLFSVSHLQKKNNVLKDLSKQQLNYNETAEGILNKQNKKIRQLERENNDLTNNCTSMEHLLKHLKLDHLITKLGKKTNNKDTEREMPINENDYKKHREEYLDLESENNEKNIDDNSLNK